MSALIQSVGIHTPSSGLVCYSQKGTNASAAKNVMERICMVKGTTPDTSVLGNKQTLEENNNFIHIFTKNSRIYICQSVKTTKFRVCYNLLEDLDRELQKGRINSQRELSSLLQEKMNYYNDPQNDKIGRLQSQIDITVDQMIENIDKMLDNSEKLQLLQSRTDDLRDNSEAFFYGSKKLKWSMKKRLILTIVIISIVCTIILGIIILIIALKVSGKI
ncbi:hypothetical protein ABK040_000655 [Willaertia magna]